jgi:hypothetical protein
VGTRDRQGRDLFGPRMPRHGYQDPMFRYRRHEDEIILLAVRELASIPWTRGAVAFRLCSEKARGVYGFRIEGRGCGASDSPMVSSDETVGEAGGAVLPVEQGLLNRGLVLEG